MNKTRTQRQRRSILVLVLLLVLPIAVSLLVSFLLTQQQQPYIRNVLTDPAFYETLLVGIPIHNLVIHNNKSADIHPAVESVLELVPLHVLVPPSASEQEEHEEEESFSACLLVMDDNHRLPEWLAYHYFALPLRYLVIAVDPHSKTSPSDILDRWKDLMTIIQWSDFDFTNMSDLLLNESDQRGQKTKKHRTRQTDFYIACTKHLKQHNRTWTSYADVDEYIAINNKLVDGVDKLFRQPGSILQMVKRLRRNQTNEITTTTMEEKREDSPTRTWSEHFQKSACVLLPRILFTAVESATEDIVRNTPSFLDATRFDTLRWRYRATKGDIFNTLHDGRAKSIIDVSRVVEPHDYVHGSHAHRALKSICIRDGIYYNQIPIGFHHYLGSWESFSYRDDARDGSPFHSSEKWARLHNLHGGGVNDEVRPWIRGFVELVGSETEAQYLLQDAGLFRDYKSNKTKPV